MYSIFIICLHLIILKCYLWLVDISIYYTYISVYFDTMMAIIDRWNNADCRYDRYIMVSIVKNEIFYGIPYDIYIY